MSKKISKILLIYNDLKKHNYKEFDNNEILKAAKDLIKYSNDEYVNKSEISVFVNDIQPVDQFLQKNYFLQNNRYLLSIEDEVTLEENEYDNFLNINKVA